MNKDTLQILARKGITLLAAYLLHAGYITPKGSTELTDFLLAGFAMLMGFAWSKSHLTSKAIEGAVGVISAGSAKAAKLTGQLSLLLFPVMLFFSQVCQAQSVTNSSPFVVQGSNTFLVSPESIPGFPTQVAAYFTSIDTNSTTFHKTNELDLWTGIDTGNKSATVIGADYYFSKGWTADAAFRNSGFTGDFQDAELGVGYSVVYYDIKFAAYADGGYSVIERQPFGAIIGEINKAMTPNTYSGFRLELRFINGQTVVTPTLKVGFTF